MKCIWREIPGTGNANGCRQVQCERCGLKLHSCHERIEANCRAYPLFHEWREWIALFSEAFGISQVAATVAFIRWRMDGSPLDKIPPRIPRPALLRMNGELSESEIEELFPNADSTLLGDRIAALTKALGIPHCGGCEARRQWLNKAHEFIRNGFVVK